MSENQDLQQNQPARLRLVIGNTDRTAEEVIRQIRRHTDAFSGLKIEKAAAAVPRTGQIIVDVQSPAADIDLDKLRRTLNEAGSCMFQVESIAKI
ncbi:hypothetical protein HSX37_12395|uniref:Uncharacterized protein n=1 Tax=Dendrosporobacter quercicolus TaxID=146817 RepID=A0A1G9TX55_9FIRM|nr:hypothetical protein [Dendrosporobacter quercicolus]NSL48833.1 hypothetical protein [Dendrosporobacter quercicolus DSM 1736]SDM51835.1 hypothetical protein SAMN04488502_105107 [Dendrosporobacter quercicolus]